MIRFFLVAVTVLGAVGSVAGAPQNNAEPQGTYLGALFAPVPEALYDHVAVLPRGQGVLITHVLPESPAAAVALRRNDIVLQYDGQKVRDCEHFARLIQADRPGHKVQLRLLRAGKETSTDVTLGTGPALKIAPAQRAANANYQDLAIARGTAKANGPAPVSINALPLENDRMRIIIEFYQDGTGKLRTVTCEGTSSEIDGEVQKLPERERSLTRRAIDKIRELNTPRPQRKSNP